MSVESTVRRVAMIGNPNTGKTTLFNALTGLSQRVGNYPGVTVEKKTGTLSAGIEVIDLPGTYSLAAWSPDELVAARVLLGEVQGVAVPDLVVVVVDAENLERNLNLVTQVMEIGIPVVVALNMVDLAERSGVRIDGQELAAALGVTVVPTIASRRDGVEELRRAIDRDLDGLPPRPAWSWPDVLEEEVSGLAEKYEAPRFLLRRAVVDMGGAVEGDLALRYGESVVAELNGIRKRIRERTGDSPGVLEARMRHEWIAGVVARCVEKGPERETLTDRIDVVLTHRVLGTLIFLLVMGAVFVSIFEWASPFMDAINSLFGWFGDQVSAAFAGTGLENGVLESFLVNGVIAGVGGVLVFFPQIAILFLFISILEDSGYLSRAAFLMDRLLRFCGLSGHSFIPLVSSFACAVPGIMATRTISDRRDRLLTILVAPLMSCSARLPVYAILIAAFVPPRLVMGFLPLQGVVLGAMYLIGILVAVGLALALRHTIVKGPAADFVMELPPYRLPSARNVGLRVYDRTKAFALKAGTIIFAMSIVVWALGYFPQSDEVLERYEQKRAEVRAAAGSQPELEAALALVDNEERGDLLRSSALGYLGRAVAPLVEPLGWDWKIGMAVIAAFPARELVVSTLGIIYDLGEEVKEEEGLVQKIRQARWPDGRPVYSLAVAISLMVFFALCCQCGATLATIKRETNSWRWPLFVFTTLSLLAYLAALITYQIGSRL